MQQNIAYYRFHREEWGLEEVDFQPRPVSDAKTSSRLLGKGVNIFHTDLAQQDPWSMKQSGHKHNLRVVFRKCSRKGGLVFPSVVGGLESSAAAAALFVKRLFPSDANKRTTGQMCCSAPGYKTGWFLPCTFTPLLFSRRLCSTLTRPPSRKRCWSLHWTTFRLKMRWVVSAQMSCISITVVCKVIDTANKNVFFKNFTVISPCWFYVMRFSDIRYYPLNSTSSSFVLVWRRRPDLRRYT